MPPEGQVNLSRRGSATWSIASWPRPARASSPNRWFVILPRCYPNWAVLHSDSWIIAIIHEILAGMPRDAEQPDSVDGARPEWFAGFLADRGTRKPSPHTLHIRIRIIGRVFASVER